MMLVVMLIDPIVQNGVIIYLTNYLVENQDDGGCCGGQSLYRATFALLVLYLVFLLLTSVLSTITLISTLNQPEEGGQKLVLGRLTIFFACLFNLQFFLFGFTPRVHCFFQMQKLYDVVKGMVHRNVPQVLLQITIIGLLLMNVGSIDESKAAITTDTDGGRKL